MGGTVRFPAATCAACPLRDRCTASATGRSVATHPGERLLVDLRRYAVLHNRHVLARLPQPNVA